MLLEVLVTLVDYDQPSIIVMIAFNTCLFYFHSKPNINSILPHYFLVVWSRTNLTARRVLDM